MLYCCLIGALDEIIKNIIKLPIPTIKRCMPGFKEEKEVEEYSFLSYIIAFAFSFSFSILTESFIIFMSFASFLLSIFVSPFLL